MFTNRKIFTLVLLSAISFSQVQAAKDTGPKGMSGSAEFGMILASGNSDSSTLNGRFTLSNDTVQWLHSASLDLVRADSKGVKTAEHYVLNAKSNYKLQDDQFLFGGLNHDVDKFSGFDYQTTLTAGYGRKLYDTDRYKLSVEIGPGYRFSKLKAGGDNNEGILHMAATSRFIINKGSKLDGNLVIDSGSSQTITTLALSYINALSNKLALKAGYNLKHASGVPSGTNNTDSLMSLSLVYSF